MRILILLLSFLISACGFHLRGDFMPPSEFQKVYVEYSQPFDPFIRKLKDELTYSNVTLVKQISQAKYILRIKEISENAVQQATSTTGQVTTYRMQYVVSFEVVDPNGKVLLPLQQVQSSESYTLSSTQLLTNFNQQPDLTAFLQQDAVAQILLRLSGKDAQRTFK